MASKRLRYSRLTVAPRKWSWGTLIFILVVVAILYLLKEILGTLAVGIMLAYALLPVQHFLSRRVPPSLAATITLCLVLLVVAVAAFIVLPLFIRQLAALIDKLPQAMEWLNQTAAPWLQNPWGYTLTFDSMVVKDWLADHAADISQFAGRWLPRIGAGSAAFLNWIANLALIPLILFYVIRDNKLFMQQIGDWVPPRWRRRMAPVGRDVDHALGDFLRGQASVMLLMSGYYSIALGVLGLDAALPVGIITGIMVIIPYLGMLIGLVLATLSGWLQFGPTMDLIWVWIIFVGGQALEGFVVTPWLVGDRIGMHPLVVVLALLVFGNLFGFIGVLLALPLSAMIMVGLRHLRPYYTKSRFYRG